MTDLDRPIATLTRIAPVTGVAFVGLLTAAAVVIGQYSYLPSGEEIAEFFADSARRVQIGAYLGALSAVFLVWFSGSVRTHLRPAEGGTGRLSAVAFGGGVAGAGVIGAAFSILAVAGARGGAGDITPQTAMVLYDVYGSLVGIGAPIALGALVGAASLVALRTGALATWLAWPGAILAVGMISPFSYIFIGISLLWILALAIVLFGRQGSVAAP